MPTYEYACSTCDTKHEVQQKMTDPTLIQCPACGESTLRKLFSGVGIHFKGSGFYRTDSRDAKSSSSSGGADSSGSTGTSTGASSTSPASTPATSAPAPAAAPSTSSTSASSST